MSNNVWFTDAIWSSNSGCEISTTCNNKSASRTSSSVLLKESTSCVGNFLINPTVSESKKGRFLITTFRTVVSKVAKSLFSTKTSLFPTAFIKVDFPTFVYPTKATRTIAPRFPRCTPICLSMVFIFSFNKAIRSRTIRLSVSISVSPGPRIPIPPFWRSKCVHIPESLGNKYWHCANSTCVLAYEVSARCAKISRIRCVLSRILHSVMILDIFFCCEGDNSSSNTKVDISFSFTKRWISSIFPVPTKVLGLGRSIFCEKRFTTWPPAVKVKNSNSSRYSFSFSSLWFWVTIPTIAVFSKFITSFSNIFLNKLQI